MKVMQYYIELANKNLSYDSRRELKEEVQYYEKLFQRLEKVADIVEKAFLSPIGEDSWSINKYNIQETIKNIRSEK